MTGHDGRRKIEQGKGGREIEKISLVVTSSLESAILNQMH